MKFEYKWEFLDTFTEKLVFTGSLDRSLNYEHGPVMLALKRELVAKLQVKSVVIDVLKLANWTTKGLRFLFEETIPKVKDASVVILGQKVKPDGSESKIYREAMEMFSKIGTNPLRWYATEAEAMQSFPK